MRPKPEYPDWIGRVIEKNTPAEKIRRMVRNHIDIDRKYGYAKRSKDPIDSRLIDWKYVEEQYVEHFRNIQKFLEPASEYYRGYAYNLGHPPNHGLMQVVMTWRKVCYV